MLLHKINMQTFAVYRQFPTNDIDWHRRRFQCLDDGLLSEHLSMARNPETSAGVATARSLSMLG